MDEQALLSAFTNDILDTNRKIIILIGSGMSLNTSPEDQPKNGIGSTADFIQKFKEKLTKMPSIPNEEIKRAEESAHPYSQLAKLLVGKDNNAKIINDILKKEIIPILNAPDIFPKGIDVSKINNITLNEHLGKESFCKNIKLNEGLESFGKLGNYLNDYTRIITSNFDPFIEIVFRKNGVEHLILDYSRDIENWANITLSEDKKILDHYHGYWLTGTAHVALEAMKNNKTKFYKILGEFESLYVFGFGGWEDAFTSALKERIDAYDKNNQSIPRIHWCFFESKDKFNKKTIPRIVSNIISSKCCTSYYKINTNIIFEKALKIIRENKVINSLIDYKDNMIQKIDEKGKFYLGETNYTYGNLKQRNTKKEDKINDFILKNIGTEQSIILCSEFGLGKTTILENLFKEYTNDGYTYSVFIDLAYHELSEINFDYKNISDIVYSELDLPVKDEKDAFIHIIKEFLTEKKILLIMDGIDESIYKDETLKNFKDSLKNINFPIIASIRLEFHDFFDNASKLDNWECVVIELEKWSKDMLATNINTFNLSNKGREKIISFNKLNTKPLFVYLFKHLEESIQENLSDNVANLYFQTISESLDSEIVSCFNGNEVDRGLAKGEYWDLLNSIAIAIYLEYQRYKYEPNNESKPRVTFTGENIRFLVSKNKVLNYEKMNHLLIKKDTDKIKIIKNISKRSDAPLYTFYHRSFLEYLVANGAASKIIKEKKCSEAWDVYQTDEVSEYFIEEVKREMKEDSCKKKGNILAAFKFELLKLQEIMDKLKKYKDKKSEKFKLDQSAICKKEKELLEAPFLEYSERLEEVLYYVGKFNEFWEKNEKNEFKKYCEFFLYNQRIRCHNKKPALDPIYYRTSAITLSRLEKNNIYIFNYISYLFEDYISFSKHFFKVQILKDIKYYGKEQLKHKCLSAKEKLLSSKDENELEPLQILKLFSLCISMLYTCYEGDPKLDPNKDEFDEIIIYYEELMGHCERHRRKFSKLLDMLEGIKYILDDLSFDINFVNISDDQLISLLRKAIEKRSDLNYNDDSLYRIVNSKGDGLDFLEVDYYNHHIVIEAKKEYYVNKKEIIKKIFKECFNGKIRSIVLKHNIGFAISSKEKEKTIEKIDGTLIDRIPCYEGNIKLDVIPEDYPKTGFFIDNRKIREYLQGHSKDKEILNLCAFTCTLGVVAKMSGAIQVINVDKEEKYLKIGKDIYKDNRLQVSQNEFVKDDIDNFLNKKFGQKFDIVILDLPEIVPIPHSLPYMSGKYMNYNKKALELLKKDGILITSCCSHGFSRERFEKILNKITKNKNYELIKDLKFDELNDHPVKLNSNYSDYLKIYVIKKLNRY